MKNRLYYQDAYIKSFTAHVEKHEQDENGKWYAVLNETAFYPTGGGQPHDTGIIADKKVVNVEEVNGEIRHYLEAPFQNGAEEVSGTLDWERRFDHMQQHAGQHILSAAFEQLFDYHTVGFHLGVDNLTIDLETDDLTREEVKKAEALANRIILENRQIETKWVTEEELSHYPLRKATKVKEDIRLVIIPDFDYNGCGGTHPKATGEVRAIKVLDWERQRKKVRVQFACGERVVNLLGDKQKLLLRLTKLLNAPEMEMEQAVVRLLENGKRTEKALEQAQESLLQYEAKHLLANNNQLVAAVFQNRTIQELQKLARSVIAEDDGVLVLFVSTNETRLQLVCARGTARKENMKTLVGEVLPLLNGKGGGNESFAQGGGNALLPAEEILQQLLTGIK
ncbi:alanyl-tRNA editing protein [Neobacillus sp. MM2021_6]|uniref:alanyl-tRNA editing protein n=1 Tax=Bacillaceae TaxID=186817 RepID=UPI00140AC303|nr:MULTISPECIES: DHHA1 domain-containing protein [Bacillaceae]MBO0958898.1 alanyl-tRNA editing protein [Neobacillus sp. MM2021_6]NHC17627.1 alanyl-tRNA editing protein [Bacillus sp. MM2020_4]